jgi:hypothetical protein
LNKPFTPALARCSVGEGLNDWFGGFLKAGNGRYWPLSDTRHADSNVRSRGEADGRRRTTATFAPALANVPLHATATAAAKPAFVRGSTVASTS